MAFFKVCFFSQGAMSTFENKRNVCYKVLTGQPVQAVAPPVATKAPTAQEVQAVVPAARPVEKVPGLQSPQLA